MLNYFKKIKNLIQTFHGNQNFIHIYKVYKKELDSIYDNTTEDIRIWSKCDWYEHGEKSTIFFLNLEKKRGNQNQILKLIFDENKIDDEVEIYQSSKSVSKIKKVLCAITTPSLNSEQLNLCEKDLSKTDSYNAMKNM